ncbi:hypothetical protein C6P40_005059, partial [Pichia californica]
YAQNLHQQQLPQKHHHYQQQQQRHNYQPQQQNQRRNHNYERDQKQQRNQQNLYRQQQQNHQQLDRKDKNRTNNYSNISNQTVHIRNRYVNDRNVLDVNKQLINERVNINEQMNAADKNNNSNNNNNSTKISPVEISKNLNTELENLKINNQSKDYIISSSETPVVENSEISENKKSGAIISKIDEVESEVEKEKEKEKEKDSKPFKSKSAFSSFFKIKRDKPRSVSHNIAESTDEPKLTFKVKRSLSHSSESGGLNSPKDFKSFF